MHPGTGRIRKKRLGNRRSKAKHPEKITGLPVSVWEQVRTHTDCIFSVEADGAKRFPVKVREQKNGGDSKRMYPYFPCGGVLWGLPIRRDLFCLKEAETI